MIKNASYILTGYKRLKVRDKYELITFAIVHLNHTLQFKFTQI